MSQAAVLEPAARPAHIPAELVRDVDFFHLIEGEEDAQEAWLRLRDRGPPIFWTPRNGGHWIVTRAADIEVVQLDHTRFSHRNILLPPQPHMFPTMLTMDPPEHTPYRRLITPAFLPKVVNLLEERVRQVARNRVRDLAPAGVCEFVAEFARVLPIVVFLELVDLPQSDAETLLPWAEQMVRGASVEGRAEAQRNMAGYLAKWIDARTVAPGEDLISQVIAGRIGERPATREEIFGACMLLLFGGLDTVASMLGFAARFLAMHPAHRRRLVAEPELIPHAAEEIIRRHGLSNTGRQIVGDFVFQGVRFRDGDLVQVPNCLHGLDEAVNADPLSVDFDRERPIRHAVFGAGPHTCPGSVLARRELRVFLEEWLAVIPEFGIEPGTRPRIATGMVNGVTELRLVWTPPAA